MCPGSWEVGTTDCVGKKVYVMVWVDLVGEDVVDHGLGSEHGENYDGPSPGTATHLKESARSMIPALQSGNEVYV
jgi:hypothetical protein